jgi:hypothetical protein
MDSLMGNPHGTQWVMASMAILKNARGRLSKNVKKDFKKIMNKDDTDRGHS